MSDIFKQAPLNFRPSYRTSCLGKSLQKWQQNITLFFSMV